MNRYRHGFTLIELLVVISIIALLSGVVLASLNSAREKGRISGARHFATQVYHTAGDYVVGVWDFDDCTGTGIAATGAQDMSGYGNNAAPTGGPLWSSDTPSGKGCSVSFNGSSQYLAVPASSSFTITSTITLSAWVKLTSYIAGGTNTDRGTVIARPAGYYLGITGTTGKVSTYFQGLTASFLQSDTSLSLNKWQHIVITYDGSNIQWYIDGRLEKTYPQTGTFVNSISPIYIGGEGGFGRLLNGMIDEARVYSKALTASEVAGLYAAEVPRFEVATN